MDNQKSQMPQVPGEQSKTCGLAIWSLVLGILTFFLFGILAAIPAVICGHIALGRIKRAAGTLSGQGMAIAGLVTGYIGLFFTLVILPAILLPALSRAKEKARRLTCASNLKQIGFASRTYASDYDGAFPDKMSRLYPRYMPNLKVFTCPSTNDEISSPDKIDDDTSYIYVSGLTELDGPDKLLAYDKPNNHHEEGRNELYITSYVKWEPTR